MKARTFQDIVSSMPVGLERGLGRILSRRVGKENAVERDELLALVRMQPGCAKTEDRQMRLAIQYFRSQGIRICHYERREKDQTTGRARVIFGYYVAANKEEYMEFRARYGSYARTIWQTIRSMDEKREVLTPEGVVEPPPGIEVQGQLFET
jgi:hypothetical protein